jgi:dCMP deaminase
MPRIKIESVYMQNAYQFAELSYAERRKVGCVIVKDKQVISFGYNGTPHGFENTCEIDNTTKPEVLHAESNAIMKVAKSTMSCEGAELYTTTCPCFGCAKLIIQAGISKVYYTETYRDMSGISLLGKAGIIVEQIKL